MDGKIAFEEHMSIPETLEDAKMFAGGSADWKSFQEEILDIGEIRLNHMDENGIGFTILSLNAPKVFPSL